MRYFYFLLLVPYFCVALPEPRHFNLHSFLHNFRNPKLLNLGPLRAGARQLIDSNKCDLPNPSYEYLASMSINAPDCIVTEKPFVNSVDECLEMCKNEPLCASLELTEGVCTLYAISYDKNPEKFMMKETKGLHAVIQRRCNESICTAPWQTKVYEGYKMTDYVEKIRDGCSKAECIQACADETSFVCKSVNYDPAQRVCEMNGLSRQNVASLKSLVYDMNTQYIENNCVVEPSMVCTHETQMNMIPNTFDAFYTDTRTDADCKMKCDTNPLGCRSYTFGLVANIPMCFLTHTVSSETLDAQEAMCILSNVNTTEVKNCYNFETMCNEDGFQVTFTAAREFDGIVFPPNMPFCQRPIENSHTFVFSASYNDPECNIMTDGNGHFETELQLQHFKPHLTEPDFIIKAECEYHGMPEPATEEPKEPDGGSQVTTDEVPTSTSAEGTTVEVTETPEMTDAPEPTESTEATATTESTVATVTDEPTTPMSCPELVIPEPQIIIQEASCPPTPTCPACKPIGPPRLGITVLHRNVTELSADPKIGDPVALAFFTDDVNSPFGPRITDVAAVNVNDDSVFQMIDKRGCPAKPYIAGKIFKKEDGLYMSHFEAFTFNQLDTIRYRASVEWCWGECKPAICDDDEDDLANQNDVYLDSLQNRIL